MIFVTVGTTRFPFNRLLAVVDKAAMRLDRKEKVIVQKGVSNYQFQYKEVKDFQEVSFDKMIQFIKKARVVITHGGPATIFLSLRYSKNKPLVLPRLKKFAEHVDNHQAYFCRYLQKRDLVKMIGPDKSLTSKIRKYCKNPEKKDKKLLNQRKKLIKKLTIFTEEIKNEK